MCDRKLKIRRQCHSTTQSHKESTYSGSYPKSDTSIDPNRLKEGKNNLKDQGCFDPKNPSKEYYKKYEHDELPVKDNGILDNFNNGCSGKGDEDINSIKEFDLDQLEIKIYSNISEELQTDSSYVPSLESNIKFFKTTVQEIFDNFYTHMKDFEQYKKRFEEILSKSKEDSVAEMEDFIKDMIQHIMTSDSSLSNFGKRLCEQKSFDKDTNIAVKYDNSTDSYPPESFEGLNSTIEAYINDNYMSDSITGGNSSMKSERRNIFNVYFLNQKRCLQFKMKDRNIVSEINMRDFNTKDEFIDEIASAENIKKLKAKNLYVKSLNQQNDCRGDERNIPVKISKPKKNIYLNEDFTTTNDVGKNDLSRSLFFKICNYLCKKLRKAI
ncbi:unnamed protein product [Parnassius apollo]|uniref:(apollo) hypothetical protein n=1 Tax=Parnassius apollo TaxID=110799 RepID=A0A8S3WFP5_PARAO|nr:unnamed protein product [Parnassius apollo]